MEAWTQSGDVQSFAGQNLFQAIDGAGEKYMPYGFRQMARTDYRKAGTQLAVTIELYDMGSTLGAFGIYSMLLSDGRDPSSMQPNAVAQGGGGFLGTGQLVFWKGQHLVQMNLSDESGDSDENALRGLARDVLPAMAARVASSLPGEIAQPAAPQGFPSDGLVWGGATYLADDVFGVDQSGPAWVGHYQTQDGKRDRLAVFSRPSADAARTLVGRFRQGAATTVTGVGEEAFSAGDFAVSRKGSTVIVVTSPAGESANALPRENRVERLRAVAATLS